jgi:hypothetical protein
LLEWTVVTAKRAGCVLTTVAEGLRLCSGAIGELSASTPPDRRSGTVFG